MLRAIKRFFSYPDLPDRGRVSGLWVFVGFAVYLGSMAIGNLIAVWAALLALIGVSFYVRWRRPIWGRFKWKCLGVGILTWLIAYPAAALVGILIESIIGPVDGEQVAAEVLRASMRDPLVFAYMTLIIVVIAPVVEELLFRGLLQSWLKRYFGRGWAIVASSAIFALFHYASTQAWLNIQLIPMLFVLGCFLGFIYEREESLLAPVGLHVLFNAVGTFALIFE